MGLGQRIARLERAVGSRPCAACGRSDHADPDALPTRVEYVVDGVEPAQPTEPDNCPACGRARARVIRVVFD